AYRRTGAADRHALRAVAASARSGGGERRISRVGGPAEILCCLRGVLQNVYGGNPAAARGRVFAAEPRLPAFRAVFRRPRAWGPGRHWRTYRTQGGAARASGGPVVRHAEFQPDRGNYGVGRERL